MAILSEALVNDLFLQLLVACASRSLYPRCSESIEDRYNLLGTNISPTKTPLKMIFLFRRWDMWVPRGLQCIYQPCGWCYGTCRWIYNESIQKVQADQTLPIGSGELFTWIILKNIPCLVLDFQGIPKIFRYTPWKINMEPQNGGLEDDLPFQLGDF